MMIAWRHGVLLGGWLLFVLPEAAFTPALAHAQLTSATPAVGSTIHAAPRAVAITYSEGVEPAFCTIEVLDAGGDRVESGTPHTAPDNNKQLLVDLKALPPGTYKVVWHATSVDTHKTQGSFAFTYQP